MDATIAAKVEEKAKAFEAMTAKLLNIANLKDTEHNREAVLNELSGYWKCHVMGTTLKARISCCLTWWQP